MLNAVMYISGKEQGDGTRESTNIRAIREEMHDKEHIKVMRQRVSEKEGKRRDMRQRKKKKENTR